MKKPNFLNFFIFPDDLIHLLKITAPKLIIFEERYARLIRQSIKDLDYDVKLMSFTENLEGVEHTDMLLKETGTESSFVYVFFLFLRKFN